MANTLTRPNDIDAKHNSGQYLIPESVLTEHAMTIEQLGELILESWRGNLRKGHANSLTITSYYWSEKRAYVVSWRPGIEGRTG